ncbi:hypothetical protein C1J03_16545 [Sulfitobacter sp. SK012]|nr:hypothetical protein C1J03_16545 [Sulfitobacter sp. SK012]
MLLPDPKTQLGWYEPTTNAFFPKKSGSGTVCEARCPGGEGVYVFLSVRMSLEVPSLTEATLADELTRA